MSKAIRQYPDADAAWREVERIREALAKLREARELLSEANAPRAKSAVCRAIKSAEGAERHTERIYTTLYYGQRRREGTA